MVFADFLKVRYGNKVIDDITRERRYCEWVAQNSEFNDNGITQKATVDDDLYSFDVEINFGKTLDDPYSRRFDEYKEEFDSEIEHDLRVGSRYKEEEFEVKGRFQPERLAQGLEVGLIRHIQGLDTAYTTLDIFQNIHILYLRYGVLSSSGYGVLSFIPLWALVSAGTNTPYLP
ncbi:hypothetical protein Tco_0052308 [Tanacetum coccineum]